MKSKTNLSWKQVGLLAGAICLVAATPILATTSRSDAKKPTGTPNSAQAAEKKAYFDQVASADGDLVASRPTDALAKYLAVKSGPARRLDPTLDLRIACCQAALGRYSDAMASLRSAQTTDPVGASTGLISAETAFLAHRNGDDATEQRTVAEAMGRFLSGGRIRPGATLTSGPGNPADPAAQTYLVFGRAFVAAYQREGADYAYAKALQLSGNDPGVSKEYAFALRAIFRDRAAEIAVLQSARRASDPQLRQSIERELRNARESWAVYSAIHGPRLSPTDAAKVSQMRVAAFRTQGVFCLDAAPAKESPVSRQP